jgi:hypothetical protein
MPAGLVLGAGPDAKRDPFSTKEKAGVCRLFVFKLLYMDLNAWTAHTAHLCNRYGRAVHPT